MTETTFNIHGLLFFSLFGGGILLALASGLIFIVQWHSGGDREQAMDRASIRGLVAIALMVAGYFFGDRAITKTNEDGLIIEIWEDPPAEIRPLPPPPPEPVPTTQLSLTGSLHPQGAGFRFLLKKPKKPEKPEKPDNAMKPTLLIFRHLSVAKRRSR